jgi:predicted transcriptional regulator
MSHRIKVELDTQTSEKIAQLAQQRGVSPHQLIRDILRESVKTNKPPTVKE